MLSTARHRCSCSIRLMIATGMIAGLLVLPGCGGGNSCEGSIPIPSISSLSPNPVSLSRVAQPFLLTVKGSGFVRSSVVMRDGMPTPTTYIDSEHLQVALNIDSPQTIGIWVHNPNARDLAGEIAGAIWGCPDGGQSDTVQLTITP